MNRVINDYERYVIPCYRKLPVVFTRGRGSWLWDDTGRKYLDFFSGWAVSSLGHAHPRVAKAIARQAARLIHIPNNYYHEGHASLARTLVQNSFEGKVFFCNSGAEAIEGAIKLARAYGNPRRNEIITMQRSFHGRTMGALSATGQMKFHKKIRPVLGGFKMIPLNDYATFQKAAGPRTVAVLLELIQGEGGINAAEVDYVKKLRRYCNEHDMLLMVDEVQTGVGRTGKMFGFQHYGITPDVMLLAKGLGSGFPIGAMVASKRVADVLGPGTHASTFGGSPIACAAAMAVFETLKKDKVLAHVRRQGAKLFAELRRLQKAHPMIREVRGRGLMAGFELDRDAKPIFDHCLKNGVLVNVTQERVVRLSPSLLVSETEIRRAVDALDAALNQMKSS
ncbi:MAG: aspartate aminotransferase family protein [Candidatus Omnitrophica bacterium]|nr:aspartate aminotransferase family protein [Candidatus Omnitrophota bacterium]